MEKVAVVVVPDYFVLRIFGERKDVVRLGRERRILLESWVVWKEVVAKRTSKCQHRVKSGVVHWPP
jgi:hypothetical protein